MRMRSWQAAVVAMGLMAVTGCGGGENPPDVKTSQPGETASSSEEPAETTMMRLETEPFGKWTDPAGETHQVTKYILSNGRVTVSIMDYGAIVQSLMTPDRNGEMENITLGFDDLAPYADMDKKDPYFGAIVGRYGNRIADGKFKIDLPEGTAATNNGETYTLATNNGPHHLHGGDRGFNDVLWHARPMPADVTSDGSVGVHLTYISADGEEGYPGQLRSEVVYRLTPDDELHIEYTASTDDKATPVNLTNHCYWNLGGVDLQNPEASESILDHELMLNCERYLPVDDTLIPTGELKSVQGTEFDFTKAHPIKKHFADLKGDDEKGGYDHCFVTPNLGKDQPKLTLVARLSDPKSGRVMEIETDQPGIQFYTGNFLSGGPSDAGFPQHHALCLETQQLPDSPNQPEFPSAILEPGQSYKHTTVHRFSTMDEDE
ncbi:aldose epimerase family protein [Thalassoroseus pseudoceratinae]|uniref:aldose epimerase family protein n=1 Tax=Thalassoroseus pseudoceratinae TaxID=2713176 RepID=UPI00142162F1|nr:aldose epimerase family protein [Thalassoroseus pseudoceratinae]